MEDAVGAEITVTSARTLYWTVTTDTTVTGTPKVAILGLTSAPTLTTTWTTAAWAGAEVVDGDVHTRTLSLLVAGPAGPLAGSPLVLPTTGEYSTWVRVGTTTDQIELQGQLLAVR